MATFWDQVDIDVRAGKGGDGLISFRHARGESRGGPDGGDGGDGGSVVLVADPGINTLAEYARKKTFAAKAGASGGKGKRHGKSADNLVLKVPVGTVVRESDALLADLDEPGARTVVARGGAGGYGNAHFTSSRRQTPRLAERGEPGEAKRLELELKLVADIGLVGVPSAGKSTLLSRVTAAKPKVADYPFTTTVPGLGIAMTGGQRLVLADIPGLIEGAHRGKGLGDAFLRHIERTKAIVHLLDVTAEDPAADYRSVRKELTAFDRTLARKPEVVALNKVDTLTEEAAAEAAKSLSRRIRKPVCAVSAAAGTGVDALLTEAAALAKRHRAKARKEPVSRIGLAELAPRSLSVEPDGDGFIVRGPRLERLASQTDFENPEAVERFWWTARRLGLDTRLEKLGAGPGATLTLAGRTLSWPGPS